MDPQGIPISDANTTQKKMLGDIGVQAPSSVLVVLCSTSNAHNNNYHVYL